MPVPADYGERVYTGCRASSSASTSAGPFEGWTYEKIMARLGEIRY